MNEYKTIGILGGMGPLATYDLGNKILELTMADCDQEHIPVLIDCNTRIADRTAAILRGGRDPLPEMLKSAKRLEAAGADFLIMPCNTAHHFYDAIRGEIGIPMLHMPNVAARRIRELGFGKAAILATDGTCRTGIYEEALREKHIETVYPSDEKQEIIMGLIYGHIKAGIYDIDTDDIDSIIDEVKAAGAEVLLLACTEMPIVFDLYRKIKGEPELPVIDATEELARAAVIEAGAKLSKK